MNRSRAAVRCLLLFVTILPPACTRRTSLPNGTVAVVDGVAITRQDLEVEMKFYGDETSTAHPRSSTLERLIGRALVVAAARRRGIIPDSGVTASSVSPAPPGVDPALWRRRLEDSRLAEAYLKRIITDRVRVCDADMTGWMRSHPGEFAGRTFEEVRPWLMPFMAARQESAAVRAHLDRLRRRARITLGPGPG